jgi:hypothetical protein
MWGGKPRIVETRMKERGRVRWRKPAGLALSETLLRNLPLTGAFLPSPFDLLPTDLPDETLVSMPAVKVRISAGTARVDAFLAVAVFVFVAADQGWPLGMKAATRELLDQMFGLISIFGHCAIHQSLNPDSSLKTKEMRVHGGTILRQRQILQFLSVSIMG